MGDVRRVYVEKRPGFDVLADGIKKDLCENLGKNISHLRMLYRYDVEGLKDDEFNKALNSVFSEPAVDSISLEDFTYNDDDKVFVVEYLPGQYDQHADSAAQCVQLLTQGELPNVHVARVYVLSGQLTDSDIKDIKSYIVNPVDSREASFEKPKSLEMTYDVPDDVKILEGFCLLDQNGIKDMHKELGLAMHVDDLAFCQKYFKSENRDPSITEIRVIDTYWSDHCRHTTFLTDIEKVTIDDGPYKKMFEKAQKQYKDARNYVYGKDTDRSVCLMDLAVICMKEAKKKGLLDDLDESEEINACSIKATIEVDGQEQDYLVMFKNETHNHPTEIEPFGGAATCLGGAIRDPLSGRSYVYQAMRVTGCGDPIEKVEDTLPGKLPQRKLTVGAAQGYSSYGNQIGLATGLVDELYHPDFVAKRMEIGAVIAAAPAHNVVRMRPEDGDVIVLIGGRTGRDGCGGATGSSKAHDEESILVCGAEVQKGNPLTERKIQRLFRDADFTRMIKRCNDFGAGGVSVAIGELADSLDINLDSVLKKYEGLDGTELAISESQERMAIVVQAKDTDAVLECCAKENLEATIVAKVTDNGRMRMNWRGKTIVDLSREFLDTNGVSQTISVRITQPKGSYFDKDIQGDVKDLWINAMSDLNVCSKRGLIERFDSTIGAGTVLMPFGGKRQLTPLQVMAAKIPVLDGYTNACSVMSYGYDPYLASYSPFHGAMYAVVSSVEKIACVGADYSKARLTLQEYFERPGDDESRWGKPYAALLGAGMAQRALGLAAIGGKDSMSGSFKDMDVPPTLCSFAVCVSDANDVISPELKEADNRVALLRLKRDKNAVPDFKYLTKILNVLKDSIRSGEVVSAYVVDSGGLAPAIAKMAFGNSLGVIMEGEFDNKELFAPFVGDIVLEISQDQSENPALSDLVMPIGKVCDNAEIRVNGQTILLSELETAWANTLEDVFPTKVNHKVVNNTPIYSAKAERYNGRRLVKPRVTIPVFPGTNCEYDTARAFERAGAIADVVIIRNLSQNDIEQSIERFAKSLDNSQILMIPGGFSGGDEPDGSGKFIATTLKNSRIAEAVTRLLKDRDGLALGICNGFQAMVKVGLVPYGEIREMQSDSPTLTFNSIGRHMSRLVNTRITSTLSPWFSKVNVQDVHTVAISHGEGRFVATQEEIDSLFLNGQVATQYVDDRSLPSMDDLFNPNGSMMAIEGITSPNGRVLGKMGHSERLDNGLYKNVIGDKDQKIFESGVEYFR